MTDPNDGHQHIFYIFTLGVIRKFKMNTCYEKLGKEKSENAPQMPGGGMSGLGIESTINSILTHY